MNLLGHLSRYVSKPGRKFDAKICEERGLRPLQSGRFHMSFSYMTIRCCAYLHDAVVLEAC